MEYIPFSQRTIQPEGDTTFYHYPAAAEGHAQLKPILVGERYPESGDLIVNLDELAVYVIAKRGRVLREAASGIEAIDVRAEEQVRIRPNEKYALEGPMKVLMISTPAMGCAQDEDPEYQI